MNKEGLPSIAVIPCSAVGESDKKVLIFWDIRVNLVGVGKYTAF